MYTLPQAIDKTRIYGNLHAELMQSLCQAKHLKRNRL